MNKALEDKHGFHVTPLGRLALVYEGSYRICVKSGSMPWIPEQYRTLQASLMMCAYMQEAGYRGKAAML